MSRTESWLWKLQISKLEVNEDMGVEQVIVDKESVVMYKQWNITQP